jgi:hypothetical protein
MSAYKLLLVTFDLTQTEPGDVRYNLADQALRFIAGGRLFNPIKQLRFVITDAKPHRIKSALEQRIGRQSSVLIMEVKDISEWKIHGLNKQNQWAKLNRAIEKYDIKVSGLFDDDDSTL